LNSGKLRGWWRRTRALAWAGAGVCMLVVIAGTAADGLSGSSPILAIPAGQFTAVVLVPVILAGLVLASARWQARTDRDANLSERE